MDQKRGSTFELRTFGGISLARFGVPVTGAAIQRRPLAVLAQLAVAGDVGLSREKLVGRLWPDSPEETARRVLAQTLYALRRALGEEQIVEGTTALRLNSAVIGSDVSRFSDAIARGDVERAVAEYAGPFLDGFHVPDAIEFERWVEEQRQRLRQEYADALTTLADRARQQYAYAAEAGWWRRRAALDPLDAGIGARLMRALHASGDVAGAVQHARIHDTLVREELGDIAPSPLQALAEQLRSQPSAPSAHVFLDQASLAEGEADPDATQTMQRRAPLRRGSAPPRFRAMLVAVGTMAAVSLGIVAWMVGLRFDRRQTSVDSEFTTLAVLPFLTLTPRADLAFLRIGIPDAIITQLANARQLRVRPTSAILAFEGDTIDPRRAGRALAAEFVVVGTVQDAGGRLRITVQLVRSADATPRWGESYELPRADLLGLQDSVARRVVDALRIRLSEAERERLYRRYTANTAAYEAYLRGRAELARHSEAGTRAGMRAFAEAVALDSAYALAWAGLGMASAEMHLRFASGKAVRAWGDSARRQTLRALVLDSSLAEVHQSLAAVARKSDFDWERAIVHSRRALDLSSSLELPHYYIAGAYYHLGLLDEADRETRIGAQVNPAGDRLEQLRSSGVSALLSGRYVDALAALEEADRLGDRSISGTYLAQARFYAGNRAEAEILLRELMTSASASAAARARALLASIAAADPQRGAEAAVLLDAAEHDDYVDHHVAYSIGVAHAQLGHFPRAIEWLDRASATGFPCFPWYARDPLLEPLRANADFDRLLGQLRAATDLARHRYVSSG